MWHILLVVPYLILFFATVAAEDAQETPIAQAVVQNDEERLQQGRKKLGSILDMHLTGVPEDTSFSWQNETHDYLGWVRTERKYLDEKPAANVRRQAINVLMSSPFLQAQCAPAGENVCQGEQLVADLDVITGPQEEPTFFLANRFPVLKTENGRTNVAVLLSMPTADRTLLLARQAAIAALEQAPRECELLGRHFDEIARHERYLFHTLAGRGRAYSNEYMLGFLLLELPGMRRLKKHPVINTANDAWQEFNTVRSMLLSFLLAYKFGGYALHSLRTGAVGREVKGPGLPENGAEEVERQAGSMPYDAYWLWKKFRSPWVHGPIALGATFYMLKHLHHWIASKRGSFALKSFNWHVLASAGAALRAIRKVYGVVKSIPALCALKEGAYLTSFYEEKLCNDAELSELVGLLEGRTLDKSRTIFSLMTGFVNRAHALLDKHYHELIDLVAVVGRIECFWGAARAVADAKAAAGSGPITYVQFAPEDERPVYRAEGLWNPFFSSDKAIASDIVLGGQSPVTTYIVTGPNNAGKSTALKAIALGALLAHTFGIVHASSCTMSVFSIIETYLNITDSVAKGQSLFYREALRAHELLERAKVAGTKPVLLIFDEMFNGTTPHEGLSAADAVAERLAQMPNVLSCIATHYMYLTMLAQKYSSVQNKCVRLAPAPEGSGKKYVRTYALVNGIADQHVALDILAEQGMDSSLLDDARRVLADVEKNGILGAQQTARGR